MVHGSRLVIDLCDTSPEDTCGSRRGAAQGNGGGQPKRRRDGSRVPPPAVPTILLSDGEESDADLARRLADAEERIRARERIREDERLARQFQEEEHESQAIFRSPHGHSAGSSRMPYAYGGRWSPGQLFGGRGRDPIGDDWLHGGGLAAGFGGHGGIGALGAAGLSALFGDGYHGYHSSPGGGGGMYGGGGRGRGRGGSFGAVYGLPSWARAAADANAHAAAMRRVLVGHAGAGRGRGGQQLAHLSFLDRDFGEADYEMLLALDDDVGPEKKRALKANAKRVEQLPSHRLSKHQVKPNDVCAICLEPLKAQQCVLDLPCKHDFHKSCILKWLKQSEAASCPVCKQPALEDCERKQKPQEQGSPHPPEEWWHT